MHPYTTSQELAEKLKAAGFPQNTQYNWSRPLYRGGEFKLHHRVQVETREVKERHAAPIAEELLAELPKELDGTELEIHPLVGGKWGVGYQEHFGAIDKSLSNSLAQLYLWLAEHGYLESGRG